MLALALYESQVCKRCGHGLYDTTSDAWDWVANDPDECSACAALDRSERAYSKGLDPESNSTPPEAMIHTVRKLPRMSVAQMKRLMQGGG